MVRRYGYAPILFSGAALFLVIGMLLIIFSHTIIGSVVIIPGLIFMGLGFFQLELLSRLRNQGIDVVFMNQEPVDNFDKRYQSQRRENPYGIAYEPWHWFFEGNAQPISGAVGV